MQHEIQVRPSEFPEQGWHYADDAEMTGFMIVVVTVGNVYVWMTSSVWFNGDENALEKGD